MVYIGFLLSVNGEPLHGGDMLWCAINLVHRAELVFDV